MDSPERKILKPKARYRTFVPMAHRILAIFTGLIIIIGIVESMVFFKMNMLESLVLTVILLFFYVILLFFLLQTRTVRVQMRRRLPGKPAMQTVSQEIANEIGKATEIKILKPAKKKAVKKKKKAKKKKSSK